MTREIRYHVLTGTSIYRYELDCWQSYTTSRPVIYERSDVIADALAGEVMWGKVQSGRQHTIKEFLKSQTKKSWMFFVLPRSAQPYLYIAVRLSDLIVKNDI